MRRKGRFDVLEKIKFLTNKAPSYMVFWVTQNCNAACSFCFNFEENTKKNFDLSIDEIDQIARKFPHLKYLTLGGGEPSLRKDLPDLIAPFVTHSGLQMCTIVTNGYLWERMTKAIRAICERFPDLAVNIGVSIDFIGEKHDEIRRLKGCYDGIVKLIESVKELRKEHPNLMIGAGGVYSAATADSILETGKYIIEKYKIPYSVNYIRGRVEDMELKTVDPDHYHGVIREIMELQKTVIPFTTIDGPFRFALEEMAIDTIYRVAKFDEHTVDCIAGRKSVVLESNGRLRLCELLPDDFGNVRDNGYDIPAMLGAASSQPAIDKVRQEKCRCTWECFNRASIAYDAKKWPRLLATGARRTVRALQV